MQHLGPFEISHLTEEERQSLEWDLMAIVRNNPAMVSARQVIEGIASSKSDTHRYRDPRNRVTVGIFPSREHGPHSEIVEELPRHSLDELEIDDFVRVRIELPRSIYVRDGCKDVNHGRIVQILGSLPTFEDKRGVYLERMSAEKHKILLLEGPMEENSSHGWHIDTIISIKAVHLVIKSDAGRWTWFEQLEAANIGAMDRLIPEERAIQDAENPRIAAAMSLPGGPRIVDLEHSVAIHTGWMGTTGLLGPAAPTKTPQWQCVNWGRQWGEPGHRSCLGR